MAGALALSLSFATLFVGQFAAALRVCVAQALAIALAAAAQGWALHSASLCIAALLIFALNGIALPLALRRVIGRTTVPRSIAWRVGFVASAAAAFVMVAASAAAVMRLTQGEQFEVLTAGLSILLLSFLLLALRSHPLLPALGLLVIAEWHIAGGLRHSPAAGVCTASCRDSTGSGHYRCKRVPA